MNIPSKSTLLQGFYRVTGWFSYRIGLADYLVISPAKKIAAAARPRPLRILFVCLGNICRSAYAGRRMQDLLAERKKQPAEVRSAGFSTTDGKPADPTAAKAAAGRGVDLSAHRTAQLREVDLEWADMIFVMEPPHLRRISKILAPAIDKSFLLGVFGLKFGGSLAVADPYGKDEAAFQECFKQIDDALNGIIEML